MKKKRLVNITIYDVPAELVEEFKEKVVKPRYPYGTSQAIRDLMRKAVQDSETGQEE